MAKRTYTPDEYQSQFVDFYNMGGIDVAVAPTAGEEETDEPVRPDVLTPVSEREDDTPNVFRQVTMGGGPAYDVSDIDPGEYIRNFGKGEKKVNFSDGGFQKYLEANAGQAIPGLTMGPVVGAIAYGAASLNRKQQLKNARAIAETGGSGGSMFTINGQTVSRAPGSIRFDGTISGMTNEQLYRLDEIRRGFVPGTMKETPSGRPDEIGMINRTGKEALSSSGDVMIDAFGTVHGAGGPQMVGAFQAERAREQMLRDALSSAGVSLAGVNVSRDALAMKQALDAEMRGSKSFFTTTARMSDADYNKALTRSQEFIRNYVSKNYGPEEEAAAPTVTVTQQKPSETPQSEAAAKSGGGSDSGGGYNPSTDYGFGYSGNSYDSSYDSSKDTSFEGAYEDDDMYARGGRVGMQEGGAARRPLPEAGFVAGPPENFTERETVADDQNGSVAEGTFVINAAAVEFAGSDDIRKMILDAYSTAREKGLDIGRVDRKLYEGTVDVALSKGEVVVPPELAKIIGYDRLEKINNRGKKEVSRRQKAAEGGFLGAGGYAEGGDVGEDIPMEESIALNDSTRQKFSTFLKSRRQRGDVEKLIDNLDDRERLFVLGLVETTAAKDSVDSMMGVMQTAINRANTDRPSFKSVNDLSSVMKQRSSRGSGSRMFQYDGLEPSKITPRLREVVQGRVPNAVTKLFMAAENLTNPETEGQRPLPFDVMFYTKPDAPLAKNFEKNPKMRYHSSFGGHDYYALDAAPEN